MNPNDGAEVGNHNFTRREADFDLLQEVFGGFFGISTDHAHHVDRGLTINIVADQIEQAFMRLFGGADTFQSFNLAVLQIEDRLEVERCPEEAGCAADPAPR